MKALLIALICFASAAVCAAEPLDVAGTSALLAMQSQQYSWAAAFLGSRPVNYSNREIDRRPDGPREESRSLSELTAYGVNLHRTADGLKVRGGVSELSGKAAAGLELIVDW